MSIFPDALIGTRYKLLDCLGIGGMGEVWKAQDTNFSRFVVVAVKLLKEGSTGTDDARYRANLERLFQRKASAGSLVLDLIVDALDESFNVGVNRDALRRAAEAQFGDAPITTDAALAFFDQVASDTRFNENARHRRRLRDLFSAEANAVAVLQHPNIVRVTDFGEHEGLPFLVMDYIAGRTLHQIIQRREPLPLWRRLRLMEDLCEGLGYAHSKDLIHRDIKPANLIIDEDTRRLKILDFGVARTLQVSAQRSLSQGAPIGTLCYMSPEQTRANRLLDNRSDIFSVGLVFYELLSHERAFPSSGDIVELVGRIQHDSPPPLSDLLPDLDPEIERIVYKAIEKVPARRYQDLSDMHRDIEAVRLKLEEADKRRDVTLRTQLMRPRPLAQQVTDLLDRATGAFDTGDDHAVIEFCDQILSLVSEQSDATELKRRAQARVRTRLIESTVDDARALLDRGELTAASDLLKTVEADTQLPTVRQFFDALHEARRIRRVATLLAEARDALSEEAVERAVDHARAVIALDAANAEASGIMRQAQHMLAQRRRREIDETLAQADVKSKEGSLEEALQLLSAFAGEPDVDARLASARRQLDERNARERALDDAVRRAEALITAGHFLRARDALNEAAALDANDSDVTALTEWLEPIVAALGQLDEGVRLLNEDELIEGEVRLSSAAAALAPYRAQYPSLGREFDIAEQARRVASRRQHDRQRREVEAQEERHRQAATAEQERLTRLVTEASDRVFALIARSQFDAAERELLDMGRLSGSDDAVQRLRSEIARARKQTVDDAARRDRDAARALAAQGQLDAARNLLQQVSPAHPLIDDELRAIGRAIVKREEAQRRADQAERARQESERKLQEAERKRHEELRAQAEAAERRRDEDERARVEAERARQERERLKAAEAEKAREEAERLRAEAARAREELEQSVSAAIAASDRLFTEGEHQRAIDSLKAFEARHPRIEAKQREYQQELDRRAAAARAEAERQRLEAKRQRTAAERARRREHRQEQLAQAGSRLRALALDRKIQAATAAAVTIVGLLVSSAWLAQRQPPSQVATGTATTVASRAENGRAPDAALVPDAATPPVADPPPTSPAITSETPGTVPPPTRPPIATPGERAVNRPRPTDIAKSPETPPAPSPGPARPTLKEPPLGEDNPPARPDAPKPEPPSPPPPRAVDSPAIPANASPPPNAEEALASARREIYALIAEYSAAYSAKDETRLRALHMSFRGLDERTRMLARSVELVISDVRITPAADLNSAIVSASQTFKYDWRRPGLPPQTKGNVSWTVVRTPSGWKIQ